MKKIILIYGSIAGAITIGVLSISISMWDPESSHTANSEWVGYLVMIVALSLIFFGVKSYRDNQLGGVIGFWDATKVGLGIAAVAGIVYVLGWELYLGVSGQDFMALYADAHIKQLQADGASALEIEEARAMMDSYKEMYKNPITRMGITFLEIFPVGLIISLISAGLLRKSSVLPASENV